MLFAFYTLARTYFYKKTVHINNYLRNGSDRVPAQSVRTYCESYARMNLK